MESKPTMNVECLLLGEFVDEAIPAKGALVQSSSPTTSLRNVWTEVIRRYTTPVEGGPRLKATPGADGGKRLAIVHFGPRGQTAVLHRAEGEELDVASDQFLALYRRGDQQASAPETTTCILWQDIQYIEFSSSGK